MRGCSIVSPRSPARCAPRNRPGSPPPSAQTPRRWAPYSLAAAFAAIAVVLGAWVALLLGGSGDGDAIVRRVSGGTIEARLVYVPADGTATLTIGGLQQLGPDQTYQLWVIRDGTPASVGFLHASALGTAGATFQHELEDGDIVAVTIEPAGGSAQPTSEPILTAPI